MVRIPSGFQSSICHLIFFIFPDELDCKMSATPLADLDKAEWSGDTLYIIIGQDPSSQINLQNLEQTNVMYIQCTNLPISSRNLIIKGFMDLGCLFTE